MATRASLLPGLLMPLSSSSAPPFRPKVLGEAHAPAGGLSFLAQGPDQTEVLIRVGLFGAPQRVTVNGEPLAANSQTWDEESRTLLVRFPNKAVGRRVVIECGEPVR